MKALMLSNQGRSMSVFWRVLIETMQSRDMEVVCCVPDAAPDLQAMNLKVLNYPLDRKGINPIKDLQTLRHLQKTFVAEKPDILFATTIKPVIYGCLAAKWTGVPHIYATITGLGYAFERDTALKRIINFASRQLYRYSLKDVAGIFFQNKEDACTFRKDGILDSTAPIYFAKGTGVDTSRFEQVPLPPDGGPIFLLVGRLLEAKGIREYAQAAAILKNKYPCAKFQLLGPPESGRGSLDLTEISQMSAIEYLGQSNDVRPYWAKAHVAVLPSWREGLPTALMEAMSMGRPLVGTDVPGCREVIFNGKNGFFAPPHNPQALAQTMEQFIIQPDLISAMGAESRKIAENNFDAHVVANGILTDMSRSF